MTLRSPAAGAPRRTLPPTLAYALVSAVVGLALFASVTPSPLYGTYRELWGFSPLVLTLVYATYAFGVLTTLILAGRLSDEVGRRPVLIASLGTLMVTTVVFMAADSVAWLFAARGLQGLATGLALASASAAMLDLHPRRDPAAVGLANGVLSAAGLGLGMLASAALGVFLLAGSASLAQLAFGRSSPAAGATWGSVSLSAGMLVIVAAVASDSAALYVAGSVIGGIGFGVAFLGALRGLSALIPAENRAAVMSAFYVVAYGSLSLPAILAGLLVTPLGFHTTFELFGAAAALLALVVAFEAWRTRPRAVAFAA